MKGHSSPGKESSLPPQIPTTRPRAAELTQLLIIASLGWLVLFWPALHPGHVFAPAAWSADPVSQYLPWMQFLRDSFRGGVFPLWDPANGLGQPFLAVPGSALFFPLTWLFALMPMTVASFLTAYLKILTAALGTYLLVRRLGMKHATAVLGGAAFAFMPHFFSHAAYPLSSAEMWIPLTLLATLNFLESGHFRWVAVLAVFFSLQMAGGDYQVWGVTVLFNAAFFLWFMPWRRPATGRHRRILPYFVFLPLALSLSGGMWLSFLDLFFRSSTLDLRWKFNASLSLPGHLFHLLMPSFFGDPRHGNEWAWAGFRDILLYAGAAILLLALAHFLGRSGWREKTFYLSGIVLFWVMSFRQPGVLLNPLLHLTPFGDIGFTRLYAFFDICLLLPALRALDRWNWIENRRALAVAGTVLSAGALLGAMVYLPFFRQLHLAAFEARNYAILLLVLGAAVAILRAWERHRRLAFCALLALVFADLYLVDRMFVDSTPLEQLYPDSAALAELVQSVPMGRTVRFLSPDLPPEINLMYGFHSIGSHKLLEPELYGRLAPYLDHSLRDGYAVTEPDPASLQRIDSGTLRRRWLKELFDLYGPDRLRTWLRAPRPGPVSRLDDPALAELLGIRYVISRHKLADAALRFVRSRDGWLLYELPNAMPWTSFHEQVRWSPSSDAALATVAADPSGSREKPVLVGVGDRPRFLPAAGPPVGRFPLLVTLGRVDPLVVEINVHAPRPGWLVLRDLYDPGWKATTDEQPAEIFLADGVCRAVPVPAGSHRIRFTYQPGPFRYGFLVGVLVYLILVAAGIHLWYRSSVARVR
jgi:hypothetical protein